MKKKGKREKRAHRLALAQRRGDAGRLLREAVRLLRSGDLRQVAVLAADASRAARDDTARAAAHALAVEARFRKAMTEEPGARIATLDAALALAPDEPRLRFHRAVALWRTGRLDEAAVDLEAVARLEPERPGLALLRGLAALALGRPAGAAPVDGDEAAALEAVRALLAGTAVPAAAPDPWPLLGALAAGKPADPERLAESARRSGKSVASVLRYYEGVARLRAGDPRGAHTAWASAREAGYRAPWLDENLGKATRALLVEAAEAGRWTDVVALAPKGGPTGDRIADETAGAALFRVGYEAARDGRWAEAASHWRKANDLVGGRALAQNLALAEEALGNWAGAAEAWRQMVRRRPRRADHPDALTDAQVAALWMHAGECYTRAEVEDADQEAVTCFKKALEYAGADTALRVEVARRLANLDEWDLARKELEGIARREPENVDALEALGQLLLDGPARQAIPVLKRVLALEPNRPGIADSLAQAYGRAVTDNLLVPESAGKLLEEGLETIPDHPTLLVGLGMVKKRLGHEAEASALFRKAVEVAPTRLTTVAPALHELLHVDPEAPFLEEAVETLRGHEGLLPAFWLDQGERAVGCELDERWVTRFFDEAIDLAARGRGGMTKAHAFVAAYRLLHAEPRYAPLLSRYEERARREVPDSGAVELIEGAKAVMGGGAKVERLIAEARRAARRNRDKGLEEEVEMLEESLYPDFEGEMPMLPPHVLLKIMQRFPNGPPEDPRDLPRDIVNEILKYIR